MTQKTTPPVDPAARLIRPAMAWSRREPSVPATTAELLAAARLYEAAVDRPARPRGEGRAAPRGGGGGK
jgi:hypothetical protein